MTIEVKSKVDTKRIAKEILQQLQTELAKQLTLAETEIVRRTQSGRDTGGGAFKPYSTGYAKQRKRKGRNTVPVDLTFTGKMLAGITSRADRTPNSIIGKIFFSSASAAQKARWNKENDRDFFGLSRAQVTKIAKALNNFRRKLT